ncbi:MAG: T9SS type A sorting domain-containing protein [Flavobacteriales bacterium]
MGTVRDAQGRIIWKKEISTNGNAIEVGSWARGVYVLELVKEKEFSTFKFVLVGSKKPWTHPWDAPTTSAR